MVEFLCTFEGGVPLSSGSKVLAALKMASSRRWGVLEFLLAVIAKILSHRHSKFEVSNSPVFFPIQFEVSKFQVFMGLWDFWWQINKNGSK